MQSAGLTQHPWLVPSVIVAAVGLLVQGIKAGWDLVLSIRASSGSQRALRLQEVTALLNLINGLPIAEAKKGVWKARLLKQLRDNIPMSEVYKTVDTLLTEVGGGNG